MKKWERWVRCSIPKSKPALLPVHIYLNRNKPWRKRMRRPCSYDLETPSLLCTSPATRIQVCPDFRVKHLVTARWLRRKKNRVVGAILILIGAPSSVKRPTLWFYEYLRKNIVFRNFFRMTGDAPLFCERMYHLFITAYVREYILIRTRYFLKYRRIYFWF